MLDVRCTFESQTVAELVKAVMQEDDKRDRLRARAIKRVSRSKYLMQRSPKKSYLSPKEHSNL